MTGQWPFRAPASVVAGAWIGPDVGPGFLQVEQIPDMFQKFQLPAVEMVGSDVHLICAQSGAMDVARREFRVLGFPVPLDGSSFAVIEVLAQLAGELVGMGELMIRF